MDPKVDGVLLIGHGTRDEDGTREFFELTDVLSRRLSPVPVEGCLLEFQRPTIPEAWRSLVDRGVKHVGVAPLLLFAAGHAKDDIPSAVAACADSSSGISYEQSGPLSRAPSIVDLLAARINQAAGLAELDASVSVVLVGRGSHDPCAQADMRVLGEIVGHRLGVSHRAVGFYAMAEPKLPEVLDEAARRCGVKTVIVQPHLLFQGRLYDAIVRQVNEAAARHPEIRFVVGAYLGPVSEVADALARRVTQRGECNKNAGQGRPLSRSG